jgi:peptide deformylase
MAVRDIIQDDDPRLRKPTLWVNRYDARLHNAVMDLRETLESAPYGSMLLTAPQIGIPLRIMVVDFYDDLGQTILINPVVRRQSNPIPQLERSLSAPNDWRETVRPTEVSVYYNTTKKERLEWQRARGAEPAFLMQGIDYLEGRPLCTRPKVQSIRKWLAEHKTALNLGVSTAA